MPRPKTDIAGGFAAAVDDIRQKVIEEPWFGRPVTDQAAPLDIWSTAKDEQEKSAAADAAAAKAKPVADIESDLEPEL